MVSVAPCDNYRLASYISLASHTIKVTDQSNWSVFLLCFYLMMEVYVEMSKHKELMVVISLFFMIQGVFSFLSMF